MADHLLGAAARALCARLQTRQALIGVVGMGYVGLPRAIALAGAGARVLGFDIDEGKAADLNAGVSYIGHITSETVGALVQTGMLSATSDLTRLGEPDAILICTPTPLTRHQTPDLSYVVSTGAAIARSLRENQLIVLESTTYPGTTQEVLRPILEQGGRRAGKDFWLAYSPEREDPGNTRFAAASIPKVVGADDAESQALAAALYQSCAHEIVPVSSSAAAEAVKISENIFRAVNIALANELKLVFGAMGVDIWEVIEAAKTKPFGYMPFYPGPGLGGHCIPIDPFYLTWKAREFGVHTRFIELAGQINSSMPDHVVRVLAEALDKRAGKGLSGARILLLGLAYKKNVDDTRESPSLRLIELLEARGAHADYHDPFVPVIPPTREYKAFAGRASQPWDLARFADYDAVLISTDHDGVDYAALAKHARLVIDTRNACARAGADLTKVVPA
jgi:UDP-N-acetyl-D-glucosamine dehydrogenase